MGPLEPSSRELLASSPGSRSQFSHPCEGKHHWDTASSAVSFTGMVPQGAGADGSPGELLPGGSSTSQPAALLCLLHTADFSFQHCLTVSLKLQTGSQEIGATRSQGKATGKLLLWGSSWLEGTGTHQLGAFISAVPREGEAVLSRGNGHHWGVHQAQLHDSGVVGTKGGRVEQPDPRGVTATWRARGQGQVTAGARTSHCRGKLKK